MTAYCEDCLPQDEIEGLGKYKPFEKLGYVSKQAYYIKCPACITEDAGAELDEDSLNLTQQMPVYHEEQEDEEDNTYLKELADAEQKANFDEAAFVAPSEPINKGSKGKKSVSSSLKNAKKASPSRGRPKKNLLSGDAPVSMAKKSKK